MSKDSRQGRPPEHPWEKWFDGRTHLLTKGRHFISELKSFRTLAHRTARNYGGYVKTEFEPKGGPLSEKDKIRIFFYKKGDDR